MGGFIELNCQGQTVIVNIDRIVYFKPGGEEETVVHLCTDKTLTVEHPYQEVMVLIESSNRP